MAAWNDWFGQVGQAMVDGDNPFGPSRSVATELATTCPIIASGGAVEVYETFQVM